MPSNDLGEFTPLVPGSGGNGHPHNHHSNHHPHTQYFPGNNNDNLSRRRHYPNNGFPPHDGNYDDESSYDEAIKGSDRRTYWSRMKEELANMLPVFRGKMRATAADCQDDEQKANFTCKPISSTEEEGRLFYMDTFNDEPWACSFGTREHVSETLDDANRLLLLSDHLTKVRHILNTFSLHRMEYGLMSMIGLAL